MKLFYSVLCIALVASACQQSTKPAESTTLLKSDSTFVVGPELPVKDSVASTETVGETPTEHTTTKKSTTKAKSREKASNSVAQSSSSGAANSPSNASSSDNGATQSTAAEPEKKGWSKTAKGAVIGGVAGAGAGAVINGKNRAAGAVIGGVLGAGAGAVIGNQMDKKDGRH